MNINEVVKKTAINTISYLTFCFFTTAALAENNRSAEDEHNSGHIELTQEQIKHAGISFAVVEAGQIRETLPVYGVITSNAEQVQSVSARFDGVISSVNKKIGDRVRKGETLVSVEANSSLKTYAVVSSLDGVITQRNANIGEQTKDKTLFVVEDFSTVWVNLSLFPKDVAKAALGQTVRITSANNRSVGVGSIIYIAPQGNSSNQATTARVLLNNAENQWKPGLFVDARITLSETAAPTVIQSQATQLVAGETIIFVKAEEGFEPRVITMGRTDGDYREVLSGLNAGETYVTNNSFVLKSEMGKEDAEHGH